MRRRERCFKAADHVRRDVIRQRQGRVASRAEDLNERRAAQQFRRWNGTSGSRRDESLELTRTEVRDRRRDEASPPPTRRS